MRIRIKLLRRKIFNRIFYDIVLNFDREVNLEKGILFFYKNKSFFPSPLFGNEKKFYGRFPPFKRLNFVKFYIELFIDKKLYRIPEKRYKFFLYL
ncbi:MAG: hypothetical protein ABIN20_03420 [candidate division WOR-3 bacterium]